LMMMMVVCGKSRLLSAGFYTGAHRMRRVAKEDFTTRVRWMPLIIELNASANMFYLLKHLLLLNLIIFKLKCNNLIFNEIQILYASSVCLLYSRFIENHPIWILEDGPLISKVVLS
jgi:hypothetical protein